MSNLALNLVASAARVRGCGHWHSHESLGEEVGAAVALKAGASAELDELRQFVKGRVAAYKYPRRIWFVDTLPTGPTGKLLRREVKPPPEEA